MYVSTELIHEISIAKFNKIADPYKIINMLF